MSCNAGRRNCRGGWGWRCRRFGLCWVVEQALGAWIDREERHRELTLEGLADVDAGRFVDQDAMDAWAGSLDTDKPLTAPY